MEMYPVRSFFKRQAPQSCPGSSFPAHNDGDHNCVKVSKWWRTRWVCVRCGRTFKEDTR